MDLEHEKRLSKVEARAESNSHRLDEMEERQGNLEALTSSISVLAVREERIEADVKEIKAEVKTITAKPGKRWESIVDKALWAVIGAAIVYMLGQIGL